VIDYLPWLAGFMVLAAVVFYVWQAMREPQKLIAPEDRYHHALENWLDGDLDGAASMLQDLIKDHPASIDPYLQLGTLFRLQGDPARAAVLHRGLTVRAGLSRPKKIAVGLALAEDLLELQQWNDAKEVLDTLVRDASGNTRYWKGRFRHWHGMGNQPEAARSLKHGMKAVPTGDRPWFSSAYSSYQLDRALQHVRGGSFRDANSRLNDVKALPEAQSRRTLVQAMLAAADNNPAEALTVASQNLLDSPDELALFLPMLQHVLLKSGQYSRTVPILERACQSENAPPSLWVDLALLYEKLGERAKALRLLESKAGHGGFTPNEAAPLLRLLVKDDPTTDFSRVWQVLDMPVEIKDWRCGECDHHDEGIRWFCSRCHAFDSFRARPANTEAH
jgi:predicted Zn-dependent protease